MNISDGYIFMDIDKLMTPVGYYSITDGRKRLKFSVKKNWQDYPYKVKDENDNDIGEITTPNNYEIVLSTKDLEIGKTYKINFSKGRWEYCGADERTVCYTSVIDDYVVGIGSYDPNDDEKFYQAKENPQNYGNVILEPDSYDESGFSQYSTYYLKNLSGFSFKLFDRANDIIPFYAAWIKIGEFPVLEYECALGNWLC